MYTERVQYAIDNFIMDDYFLEMQKNYHLKEEKDSGKSDLDVTIKMIICAFIISMIKRNVIFLDQKRQQVCRKVLIIFYLKK